MTLQLTEEQVAEVARIKDIVMAKVRVEVDAMAEMMVSKSNGEFFGGRSSCSGTAATRSGDTCWTPLSKSGKKRGTEVRK